jgi:hypothetical protein
VEDVGVGAMPRISDIAVADLDASDLAAIRRARCLCKRKRVNGERALVQFKEKTYER